MSMRARSLVVAAASFFYSARGGPTPTRLPRLAVFLWSRGPTPSSLARACALARAAGAGSARCVATAFCSVSFLVFAMTVARAQSSALVKVTPLGRHAGELSRYLSRKIQNIRGSAPGACAEGGLDNTFDVPLGAPCTASLRPGGSRTARRAGASAMVRIAAVQAIHSNGVTAALVDSPGEAPGLSGYGGSEAGFIITFSNGLVAYLTGDTGMFGDMETIISRYYKPTLVVPNMSDTVTLGPNETVYMMRNLVRPRTVMPSHVNEQATQGGVIRGGTRVDLFQLFARDLVDVVVPVSDVTRSFDGAGRCIGCR